MIWMSLSIPDAVSQSDIIGNLSKSNRAEVGSLWFLVASRWHSEWEQYVRQETFERPESIVNDELLDEDGYLRPGLLDLRDYVLVCAHVWEKLHLWYGGGPEIARPMIETGLKRRLVVEVYRCIVHVAERRNISRDVAIEISKGATGKELHSRACEKLMAPPHRCVLWKLGNDGYERISLTKLLMRDGVDESTLLLLEEALPDGSFEPERPFWERPKIVGRAGMLQNVRRMGGELSAPPRAADSDERSVERGVTGLVNVGNTCFMNSSLQCVTACSLLREYLISNRYEKDLNKSNPLGMSGRVASALAELMKQMWAEENLKFVVPRALKEVISDFAPQFEGYRQHDSQEFLSFLLDGLHEDLNRVKKKPQVASENAFGMPEHLAAAEAWKRHLLRNNSRIVELFHGQFRSKLICPSCTNVSVTFDPFSVLSLPLPRSTTRSIAVTLVPLRSSTKNIVEQIFVTIGRGATIQELIDAVATAAACSNRLFLAEIYQKSVYKEFSNPASEVAAIGPNDDLFAFEVALMNDAKVKPSKKAASPLKIELGSVITFSAILRRGDLNQPELFGTPMVFSLPLSSLSVASVTSAVHEHLRRHLSLSSELQSLSLVSKSGKKCGYCQEIECRGCLLTEDMLTKGHKVDKVAVLKPRMFLGCNLSTDSAFVTTRQLREDPRKKIAEKAISLDECIERFLESEILSELDTWFCPSCRSHVQAEKQIGMFAMPRLLVVHLKRFAFLSNRYREKLEDLVSFPLKGLNLSQYMLPSADKNVSVVYDLVAVSNHMGGLGGGHYTAYGKVNDTWWLFNDEHCSHAADKDIVSKNAYILYYQRRDE